MISSYSMLAIKETGDRFKIYLIAHNSANYKQEMDQGEKVKWFGLVMNQKFTEVSMISVHDS